MDDGVRRLSGLLRRAATLALVALPLGVASSVIVSGVDLPVPEAVAVSDREAVAVKLLGLVPMGIALWILVLMRRLFGLFRDGRALSEGAATAVGRMGRALVLLAAMGLVVPTLQILVVTLDEGPGLRQLSIAFGSGEVGLALAGGLMAVLGAAMREGAAAARENASFV